MRGRERAEEALKGSEERFRLLVQGVKDYAIFMLDPEGRITSWNEGARRLKGYQEGEIFGRHFSAFYPEEDVERGKPERALEIAKAGGTYKEEGLRVRKDGSKFWASVLITALRDEEGNLRGFSKVTRDITERKRAEDELIESEERFRATFEQAAVGMAHVAPDGRWLKVNRRLCDIVGYTQEELLGLTVRDVTYPDDLEADLEYIRQLLAGEIGTYSMEKRYLKKDGSIIWINLTVSLVRDPGGEPRYFIAVIEDITERKRAEEEIRTRSRQQEVIADLGMRALTETDLSVLMEEAVALVARTLGVEYSEVLELLPEGDALVLRAGVGWKEGLVGNVMVGASFDSHAGYTLLSGEPVIVEDLRTEGRFTGPPLLHEHGVVSGMSVVIRYRKRSFGVLGAHTETRRTFTQEDVNFLQAVANVLATAVERKEAEEELRKVKEAERKRMARELHDGTLQDITYALAEAQLVQKISNDPAPAPEELEHRLGRAVEALKRAGQALRAAVYDLRLEEEQDKPFAESLESLVRLHRTMAPDLAIDLVVEGGFPSRHLGKKGTALLRILQEALTNTRRHSGARNVRVRLGIFGGKLWTEVTDDGQGFGEGTTAGVGLRSMRERAHALGGELKIESEPGRGTKVRFEMTLEEDWEKPQEEIRVLLVDDHASLRQAVASMLEQKPGIEVVGQAGSLAEARKMIEEGPAADGAKVDVAIVDLALPDGYGGDLIKELREANPQAQALVLSATPDRAEVARAVEAGAAGVLHKSAGMEQVVEAVRRLRAGETLLPLEEVVELLRLAGSRREEEYEARRAIARLTPREREVLEALAEGLDAEEIAQRLHISASTERNHMASILAKLGVHSRLQALVFALRHGMVDLPPRQGRDRA